MVTAAIIGAHAIDTTGTEMALVQSKGAFIDVWISTNE